MFLVLTMTNALALTCDPGDALCTAVNDMTTTANTSFGGMPVRDSAKPRLRPQTFLDNLQTVLDQLETGGCTTTNDLQTYLSGSFNNRTPPGSLTGAWESGMISGGTVIGGTMDGLDAFGDTFGAFNRQLQVVANRGADGFVAGYYARVKGRRGVFMAVTGVCDGPTHPAVALDPWYQGDLSGWVGAMADPFVFRTDAPGAYTRVDRMGMPAVATVLITSKDAYNAADPVDDAAGAFVPEIVGSITGLHGALDDDLLGLGLTPCDVGTCVAQGAPLVVPDTISIDPAVPAGFPNGRLLPDPVIDVTLAVLMLDLGVHPVTLFAGLPLNPPANDVPFAASFPFLAGAH